MSPKGFALLAELLANNELNVDAILAAMTELALFYQQPHVRYAPDGTLLDVSLVWTHPEAERCYAQYHALLETMSVLCLKEVIHGSVHGMSREYPRRCSRIPAPAGGDAACRDARGYTLLASVSLLSPKDWRRRKDTSWLIHA